MARKVMGALVVSAMGATPVLADVYASAVVQQLEAEGFRDISTERTWLGRMRIVGESGDGQREIIINPNNGEVLRDLWLVERRDGDGSAGDDASNGGQIATSASAGDDNGSKSSRGKTGGSDDDNDDKEDRKADDKDRDRSWSRSDSGGGGGNGYSSGDSDD